MPKLGGVQKQPEIGGKWLAPQETAFWPRTGFGGDRSLGTGGAGGGKHTPLAGVPTYMIYIPIWVPNSCRCTGTNSPKNQNSGGGGREYLCRSASGILLSRSVSHLPPPPFESASRTLTGPLAWPETPIQVKIRRLGEVTWGPKAGDRAAEGGLVAPKTHTNVGPNAVVWFLSALCRSFRTL